MKKQILLILFGLTLTFLNAQKNIIDSTLITKTTFIETINHSTIDGELIKLKGYNYNSIYNQKYSNDTLTLMFARKGLGGQIFKLNITDIIVPEIILWSDYPAFNGKYFKSLEFEQVEIIANKKNYKSRDTIMIKLKCISKQHKGHIGHPKFEYKGTIKHILKN